MLEPFFADLICCCEVPTAISNPQIEGPDLVEPKSGE